MTMRWKARASNSREGQVTLPLVEVIRVDSPHSFACDPLYPIIHVSSGTHLMGW